MCQIKIPSVHKGHHLNIILLHYTTIMMDKMIVQKKLTKKHAGYY